MTFTDGIGRRYTLDRTIIDTDMMAVIEEASRDDPLWEIPKARPALVIQTCLACYSLVNEVHPDAAKSIYTAVDASKRAFEAGKWPLKEIRDRI